MSSRTPWIVRAAVRLVPEAWRDSVARDLADDAGRGWPRNCRCAVQALGVAVLLHWAFTRTAMMSDIRYAIRSMLRARWFTVGAILTFALGIGVNVTVFSAVDRMLFRTLPYAQPDDLYVMTQFNKATGQGYGTLPRQVLVELRRRHQGIVDASQAGFSSEFTVDQDPIENAPFRLTAVTYNTLGLFGVHPLIGRDFTREDAETKRSAALISYELWQTRFGGARDVIGRSVWANHKPVQIVGVLPRDFIAASSFLDPLSSGLALDFDTMDTTGEPNERAYAPYVRLKPGVTPTAAAAEANALDEAVEHELGQSSSTTQLELRFLPLKGALFGNYVDYLVLVAAAAGLVLLVACGNLASLMLVRFRSRQHIAAMQAALGASTRRLMTTALIEASILSVAGAAVGLIVFGWASIGLRALLPPIFSRFAASAAEPRVLLFTMLMAAVSTTLVAALPAWRLAHVDAMSVLKRGGTAVRGRRAGGRGLLAVEAALSVVLVVAAAATGRSLLKLEHTNLGFQPRDLYRVTIGFPATPDETLRFQRYGQTAAVLGRMRGVRQAAWTNDIFLTGSAGWKPFAKGLERQGARSNISAGFFETLGTPILAGRTISAADVTNRSPVAILNQSAVQLVWPGVAPADSVGRFLPFDEIPRREVVGVVADMRSRHGADVRPNLYLPLEPAEVRSLNLIARVENGSDLSANDLRQRIREEVASPTSVTISSVTSLLDTALLDQKFRATLFVSFGVVALLLAALGLYAVSTFEVTQRRAEMGIRIALGATEGDLRALVIRETLTPVSAGVAAGAGIAFWAAKFLQSFLYQLDARDPWTLTFVSLVLLTTATLAAWAPARRASATDPVAVLRAE